MNLILFPPSITSFSAISVLPSLFTFIYLFCVHFSLSLPVLSLSVFPRSYLPASTSFSTSSLNASSLPHLSPFLHLYLLLPLLYHIVSYLHHVSPHHISFLIIFLHLLLISPPPPPPHLPPPPPHLSSPLPVSVSAPCLSCTV
jgi:hypothetical protein